MKRILLIVLALSFVLIPYAQTAQRKKTTTTAKTARTVRTPKNTAKKKPVARRPSKAHTRAEKKTATYSNASIRGLQGQRANIQKKIKEQ